jgi:hypothetical protein
MTLRYSAFGAGWFQSRAEYSSEGRNKELYVLHLLGWLSKTLTSEDKRKICRLKILNIIISDLFVTFMKTAGGVI